MFITALFSSILFFGQVFISAPEIPPEQVAPLTFNVERIMRVIEESSGEGWKIPKDNPLAKPIATCEGFYKEGSVSHRNNNPGNIKGRLPHDKYGHTIFKTE